MAVLVQTACAQSDSLLATQETVSYSGCPFTRINNQFALGGFALGLSAVYLRPVTNMNESASKFLGKNSMSLRCRADDYLQYAPQLILLQNEIRGVKGRSSRTDAIVMSLLNNITVCALVTPMKRVFTEWRPDGSSNHSFPSGHTATAFAGATMLDYEYRHQSIWYPIAGYASATATGLLRVVNNRHWLGDIVAGAAIGYCSSRITYWAYPRIKKLFTKRHEP